MLLNVINSRSCGECTACCTVLSVQELNKMRHQACEHVCKSGCEIYEKRPKECKNFKCAWLNDANIDVLNEDDRPDKLGILIWSEFVPNLGQSFFIDELWQDALKTPRAQEIFKRLISTNRPVIEMHQGPERIIYTNGKTLRAFHHAPEKPWALDARTDQLLNTTEVATNDSGSLGSS